MSDGARGYVWPLVLVFLAAFAVTLFSLIQLAYGPETAPPFPSGICIGAAVVTAVAGLVLYCPKLLLAASTANIEHIGGDVAAARTGITELRNQLAQLQSAIGKTQQQGDLVAGLATAIGGFRKDLAALGSRLDAFETRLPPKA